MNQRVIAKMPTVKVKTNPVKPVVSKRGKGNGDIKPPSPNKNKP